MGGLIVYLDYESFVDCLIKSGYNKQCSDLNKEYWGFTDDVIEITHIGHSYITNIKIYEKE